MRGARLIDAWSMFGRAPLVVEVPAVPGQFSLDVAVEAFGSHGAVVESRDADSLVCTLPVSKFIGVGYKRGLGLRCALETRRGADQEGRTVVATCDLRDVRKAKRFLFYFLSVFIFLIALPRLVTGWDITSSFFLFLPLPISEISFSVDRERLRAKLLKILRSVGIPKG